MTLPRTIALLFAALTAVPVAAQDANEPLSAIDWLSQSVASTAIAAPLPAIADEPAVTGDASVPGVTVTALDAPSPDAVGLLATKVTGLPRSLWSASTEAVLTTLVAAERVETLPALQDLVVTLMLAEADPPLAAGADGAMFIARIDTLLDLGALEPAQAMLEAADLDNPEVFRRWFDVSLLTGSEHRACRLMAARPRIAPTFPARVFCLAREGDWPGAALTLNTGRALGDISPEEDALLSRFLDPDLYEGEPPLPPPSRPSPLVFRMHEAIGEAMPTAGLPRAFAHADLRATSAWRSQLEAAERLARAGAVSDNQLLGIFTANTPAASGGIWDRARAIQALDAALTAGDKTAVAAALPAAVAAMHTGRTETAFARLYGPRLLALELPPEAAALAFDLALLSPGYEAAALAFVATTPQQRFRAAIARGLLPDTPATDPQAAAVLAAFDGTAMVPEPMAGQITAGQLGEALLRAVAAFNQGLSGDPRAVTDALVTLRAVGMEDVARRAALQYLILDRPA